MPAPRACPITLTASDRRRLNQCAAGHKTPFRERQRALIVLWAARGYATAVVAARVDVSIDTARKWRTRFAAQGMAGLADLPRSGRPRRFTEIQRAEIKALACELPATQGVPLSRWTCLDLAFEVVNGGIVDTISPSTVRRVLTDDAIKPWQHRSWISVRDPDFAVKAKRVLDLYARMWDGQPLDDNEYVISADEKTSIQARCRCHPTLPPGKARAMRVEHDYHRGGALAYLTAYDVHRAKVIGRCAPTTGITPFQALAEQVMTQEPYASAKRVFWIVDNGSSHRGDTAVERLAEAFPTAVMVHTPIHASWVNQVEIYYSIVQRKVLTPNDFTGLAEVESRLAAFEQRFNATATPFDWTFTADDLHDRLTRIDRPERADQPEPLTTQKAA
ncbi:MAG: IS630 family transposase [Dermatophilaceae bacterium]